jgi:hypothetical protein
MESKERKALERIESLVRNQVVSEEGDDCTPPSFLDIYNAAAEGLKDHCSSATCEMSQGSS